MDEKKKVPVAGSELKNGDVILSVKNLVVSFRSDQGMTHAVRDISFDLHKGETLCIVGESGSGKSVSCKTIMGILNPSAVIENGTIMYEGEDLTKLSEKEFQRIRGNKIGMVFQDPLSSLNPIMKIGKQITEGMMVNKDRLKIKFNEYIVPEFSEYNKVKARLVNAKARVAGYFSSKKELKKLQIAAKIQNKQKLAMKRKEDEAILQKDPSQRAKLLAEENAFAKELAENSRKSYYEEKRKLKEAHRKAKAELKVIRKETKAPLKEAKANLREAKKRAKLKLEEYKKEVIANYERQKAQLLEKYPSKEECEKQLNLAKATYNETSKKLDIEMVNKISDIKKNHVISPSNYDVESQKIEKEYDAKKKALYLEKVKPLELQLKEREVALQNLYFDEYASKIRYTKAYAKRRALEVMKEVGIPQAEQRYKQYPFEFSGGMRQRIVIAIALTANPEILICDEPTTALDVTIQAQILELINDLKKTRHLSCIFITHDMGVVAEMADRICVMYAGKIVEYGTVNEIFYDPKHPYTWALLSSIPDLDSKEKLEAIPGTPPNMNFPPEGDAFALRSKYAMNIDFKKMPPFFKVTDTHYAATWLLDPRAPKTEMPKIVKTRIENSLKKAGVVYEHKEQD